MELNPKEAEKRAAEVDVRDLERKGFEKVKVLRERDLDRMIRQAVDAAVAENARDRERALAEARKRIEEHAAEEEAQRALLRHGEALLAELARTGERLEAELRETESTIPAAEAEVERLRRANAELAERNRELRERLAQHEAEAAELAGAPGALLKAAAEMRAKLAEAEALLAERGDEALRARLTDAERRATAAERTAAGLEKRLARARADAVARRPKNVELGKGLDIGTANLVGALQGKDGPVHVALQRNAFIEVEADAFTRNMLDGQRVPYAEIGGKLYVVGDAAFELANVLNRETRRPMAHGILSPKERDALPIMKLIIERLLGKPQKQGEICAFSVPAEAIDSDANCVYHEKIFQDLLARMGYDARPVREGHAVVLAELADDDFTGIGISCGGGMFNVCVAYKSVNVLSFSTARGGDWIDVNVAQSLGIKKARATAIKEGGIDLRDPKGREQQAVAIYYRALIQHTLGLVKRRFEDASDRPDFPDPVDIVFAGGTSMIGGFIDVVRDELKKLAFPIPVKDVRLAEDPLHAVAKGCLVTALSDL